MTLFEAGPIFKYLVIFRTQKQSNPYKMFAAFHLPDLQGQKPKWNSTILVFKKPVWVQHPFSRRNKKKLRKNFFRLNLEVLLINRSLWNLHMVIAFILNLNLWIHKNFVCPLHRHEKWAYFYVMEAKNGLFQFFLPPGKLIEVNVFFFFPLEKFYDIWPKPTKMSSKPIKLLLHKVLWCFRQIGKWKF